MGIFKNIEDQHGHNFFEHRAVLHLLLVVFLFVVVFTSEIITTTVSSNIKYPLIGDEFKHFGYFLDADSQLKFDDISFLPYKKKEKLTWGFNGVYINVYDEEYNLTNQAKGIKLSRESADFRIFGEPSIRKSKEAIVNAIPNYKKIPYSISKKISGNQYFYKIDKSMTYLVSFFISGNEYHMIQANFDTAGLVRKGLFKDFIKFVEFYHSERDCIVGKKWIHKFSPTDLYTSDSRFHVEHCPD